MHQFEHLSLTTEGHFSRKNSSHILLLVKEIVLVRSHFDFMMIRKNLWAFFYNSRTQTSEKW